MSEDWTKEMEIECLKCRERMLACCFSEHFEIENACDEGYQILPKYPIKPYYPLEPYLGVSL